MKLLNSKQAAEYLNVSARTLARYRKDGLIEYTQVRRKIYYTEEDLDRYIARFKRPAYSAPDFSASLTQHSKPFKAHRSWK